MKKNERHNIYIAAWLWARLDKFAKEEGRSISAQLSRIVKEFFDREDEKKCPAPNAKERRKR